MACPEDLPLCALVVGHRASAKGAVSVGDVSEWDYNRALAEAIKNQVEGVRLGVIYRDDHEDGLEELPGQLNALDPDFVVSLHFNSVGFAADGSEVCYYPGSTEGKKLAELLLAEILEALQLSNRGVKPRPDLAVLAGTTMPAVLGEPFFGSDEEDWQAAVERKDLLARAYARAIEQYGQALASS